MITSIFSSSKNENAEDISCAYIENIRQGVYDENGDIFVGSNSQSGNVKTQVTSDQTTLLTIMFVSCVLLSLYSCFLHHEITNLLLHKLSYQGSLFPKSRTRRDEENDSRTADYYSYESDSFSSYT